MPIEVEAIGPIPCGDAFFATSCQVNNCPPVVITIDPVNDICLDASTTPFQITYTMTGDTSLGNLTWTGNSVDDSGLFDPGQASIGANTVIITYQENTCIYSESITINVFETPIADFTADVAICVNNSATVIFTGTNNTNLNYTWDFAGGNSSGTTGPGPHDISWALGGTYTVSLIVENMDGCFSEMVTNDVLVEEAIQEPTVNCSASTTAVTFSWNSVPGVTDSTIVVSTPQAGDLVGTTYTLNNLQPDTPVDFELTLIGAGACPTVVVNYSCATIPCPSITVDVDDVPDLCLGAANPILLNPVVMGSGGSGTGTWYGGGVDPNSGLFDPAAAGTGSHMIKYIFEEVNCTFEDSISINVFQQPSASFMADALVCITNETTVTFDGTAGNSANFIWNFDGGTAVPGNGPGPHQVTWDTPGNKTITLDLEDNGCVAGQFVQQVQVDDQLALPFVQCSATTESVEFSWTDVPGATGYEIEILTQGSGPQAITDATYLVDGLAPGEEVVLLIMPTGNTVCVVEPSVVTCSANLCSDVTVEVLPVNPICFVPIASQVTLEANVSDNTGAGFWSGPGIINPFAGIFDPLIAGEGLHTVSYNYQLVNCSYVSETEIKIAAPPTADAGEDASLTCWESESSVRLGGDNTSTGPNVIFEWTTVDGDLPDNTSILRPEVSMPGTYILTVSDLELGCSSMDEVTITASQGQPLPSLSFTSSDCSGQNTTATVDFVAGGVGPYLYSLNGEPFVEEDTFAFLPSGDYTLSLIDAAGCESETEFEIEESGEEMTLELTANLVGRNHIEEGETIQLLALLNVPMDQIDSIVWTNPDLLSCTACLDPTATPLVATNFTVSVYMNGCEISAELFIHVEYKNPIYVPSAFSPNDDNVNDIFELYAGPRVVQIKSFMVFDRWGEMVADYRDFEPNEPGNGWDGTLDGKDMLPGIFVWLVEAELADGAAEVLKGEVILIR